MRVCVGCLAEKWVTSGWADGLEGALLLRERTAAMICWNCLMPRSLDRLCSDAANGEARALPPEGR